MLDGWEVRNTQIVQKNRTQQKNKAEHIMTVMKSSVVPMNFMMMP
jgi:hypothetical protein